MLSLGKSSLFLRCPKALGFIIMLFVFAASHSTGYSKVPEITATSSSKLWKLGPWTVFTHKHKDTIAIYNQFGEVHNMISLKGIPGRGIYPSVDNKGNCLVNRNDNDGGSHIILFNTQGKVKWKKPVEDYGPHLISPNGKYIVRASGQVDRFQCFTASNEDQNLPTPLTDFDPSVRYHADFSSDNMLILFIQPGILVKADPNTGRILHQVQLSVDKSDSIKGPTGEYVDHASNSYRTKFAEVVQGIGSRGSSIIIFDKSLENQALIDVNGMIMDMKFADSSNLVYTIHRGYGSESQMWLAKEDGGMELMETGAREMISYALTFEGNIYTYALGSGGASVYNLARKTLIHKNSLDSVPLFKNKNTTKKPLFIPIEKQRGN